MFLLFGLLCFTLVCVEMFTVGGSYSWDAEDEFMMTVTPTSVLLAIAFSPKLWHVAMANSGSPQGMPQSMPQGMPTGMPPGMPQQPGPGPQFGAPMQDGPPSGHGPAAQPGPPQGQVYGQSPYPPQH